MLPYKRLLFCTIGFFSIPCCLAQDSLPVAYLGIEQGLSNNAVTSIYKDPGGFMWFGTYDGLNRYDGYGFKIFRNRIGDSTSLGDNHISAINGDAARRLWVACEKSVNVYDPATGRFAKPVFKPVRSTLPQPLTSGAKTIEVCNNGQTVLVGTAGKGLVVFTVGRSAGEQIPLPGGGAAYSVNAVAYDAKRGTAWLLVQETGLYEFDAKKKTLTPVNLSIKGADCLKVDAAGNLWLGNEDGLFRYDAATNSFSGNVLPYTIKVVNLFEDNRHTLWLATDGGGVWFLANASAQPQPYKPGAEGAGINSNAVYAVYEDADGGKWIGTLRGGVNVVRPQAPLFKCITYRAAGQNNNLNNFILSFCEDPAGNVWIGTDGAGLRYWNRRNDGFTQYVHSTNKASVSSNFITSMAYDARGDLWLSTWFGGVSRLKKGTNVFERFSCVNPATGRAENNAWLVFEDAQKRLWVSATNDGTLYLFNRQQRRFEAFDTALRNLQSLAQDRSGVLWAGNYSSLIRIDAAQKKHSVYPVGQTVRCLHEDGRNNFWVGTDGGGLLLFNRNNGKYQRFTTADGLPSNTVLRILEDDKGYLWLSTYNGLCRFNPAAKSFRNYGPSDGLQSNQFSFNAALALRSGEFLFGGIKGFNVFHPARLTDKAAKPPVFLTAIKVANKPIESIEEYVTARSAESVKAIALPYSEAALSLDFVALDYTAANKLKYAYQLRGWDKGWTYVDNLRTANYSRLNEGRYTFTLKVMNAAGEWGEETALLAVAVLPPPYRTWWAYLLYALAAAGLVYFYIHYKTRQARLQYNLKITKLAAEKEQARLQYDLQLTQLAAEKERELTERRLSFFTHISHEFRTPLTLIINPVKDLLKKSSAPEERKELGIVNRNARRLLSLVDQLLLFRKAEAGADSLRFSKQNFYTLCHEVYLCFVQQAKLNGQDLLFQCTAQNLPLYVDSEKIEIALYNLLSNAVKYTPKGGRIVFRVSETETEIKVEVEDNGPGIPKASAERLFEKFYQAPPANGVAPGGFGIGLYLVKHFVEAHKGRAGFESKEGKGTTFFIALQKGKDHLAGQTLLNGPGAETKRAPQVEAAEPEPDPPAPAKEEAGLEEVVTGRQTVLVADDNEEIRGYLKEILSGRYRVLTAGSGEEALEQTRKVFPDMVISDIRMDGLSGIALCKAIKSNDALSHIPVVLLTGGSGPDVELQSVEGGADVYITKPFDKDILLGKVGNLFKSRNELQNYFFNEITLKKNTLKISPEYKEFLERCIAVVEAHLYDDQFGVKPLAKALGMSHSALYKRVRAISGQSANGFIRYIRLRKAAELLLKGDCNVNQAAFQVGIADAKYFRAQFNKLFGMNPSDYIKKYRQPFNETYNLSPGALKKGEDK